MKNLTLIANTISKEYRSKTVVNSVSLEVNQGEIVGLLGPNGAGKTTSFYIIVGLIQPNSGKIFLGSENITSLPMYKRARKGIGYLAQEASVFRNLINIMRTYLLSFRYTNRLILHRLFFVSPQIRLS